jgi:hypothetical protein
LAQESIALSILYDIRFKKDWCFKIVAATSKYEPTPAFPKALSLIWRNASSYLLLPSSAMTRLSGAVVGLGNAFALLPIGMLSDSGTPLAVTCGTLGMVGVLLLAVGGIAGIFVNQWIALLPGSSLVMFAYTPALPPLGLFALFLLFISRTIRKK